MSIRLGQRAIVIGAGVGGSSAADALSPCFEDVVVLERDLLPSSAASRAVIPGRAESANYGAQSRTVVRCFASPRNDVAGGV
jgi:glycine/D-amino acid oxidase-like deaminating enzyme